MTWRFFFALSLGSTLLAAHGLNVAFTEIKIGDQQVAFRLHLPVLDADQALRIDTNGNGFFDPHELVDAAPRARQYLGARVKAIQDGGELPGDFGPLTMWAGTDGNPYVETTVTFRLTQSGLQQLTLACDLFREQ